VRTQDGPQKKRRRAGGAHKASKPNPASPSRADAASDWRSGRQGADDNVDDEGFAADEDADDDADMSWGLDLYDDTDLFALPAPTVLFKYGQHAQVEAGWGGMPRSPTVEAFG
jgi:hypothetical protein